MSHPCDGHACDHCYLCDVVGICCLTVPRSASALPASSQSSQLRETIVEEAKSIVGLAQLIRVEIALHVDAQPAPLALPAGRASCEIFTDSTEKETEHVNAPRRDQQ